MYMRSLLFPAPGIDARVPIGSGCLAVAQMLTVAHRNGESSTVGASAACARGAMAASARVAARATRSIGTRAAYLRVMDRPQDRSVGVGSVMELSTSEPTTARFDALYRETASDVFAYVMTLVRDRASAEDVTALTFERAYRRQSSFDARRGTQRSWLFGIARNAALDELRSRKRTTALLADPE